MKSLIAFLFLFSFFVSCKKETDEIIWQRSFGSGNASFIKATSDSGFLACGELNNKPYLVKLSSDKSVLFDYTNETTGLFSCGWMEDSCLIAGGTSNGEMLLARINNSGNLVWDTTITAAFNLDIISLCYTGDGEFLATGSAIPNSADSKANGLIFIRFDTTGQIIENKEITETDSIAAINSVVDNSGNIYLAFTRKTEGFKASARIVKYNSSLQKQWEKMIYNNSTYTTVCSDLVFNGLDSLYVTGKIEVARTSGTLDNSFAASISTSGNIGWKKYLENSNSGTGLTLNNSDVLFTLNRNCFIISAIDPYSATVMRTIRMFSSCDSYNTDSFGEDIDLFYDGNILVAGSSAGSFWLALKGSV